MENKESISDGEELWGGVVTYDVDVHINASLSPTYWTLCSS